MAVQQRLQEVKGFLIDRVSGIVSRAGHVQRLDVGFGKPVAHVLQRVLQADTVLEEGFVRFIAQVNDQARLFCLRAQDLVSAVPPLSSLSTRMSVPSESRTFHSVRTA